MAKAQLELKLVNVVWDNKKGFFFFNTLTTKEGEERIWVHYLLKMVILQIGT